MSKKYRVGIIGFGHMHVNNVAALYAKHPQVEMTACADTVPLVPELREAPYTRAWNLKNALNNMGVKKAYEDYHDMLAKESLDIAIVQSENAQHPAIVEACASAGVNVCVEKPMAVSLSDALRMARTCGVAGTKLVVNWPITWSPSARKAKELIDKGIIGRVLEVKWRAGHTGPLGPSVRHAGVDRAAEPMTGAERGASWWHQVATGGGAMLDFCCYGAMISYYYIGEMATAAIGMKANLDSHWGEAEDNAAMLIRYPSAMALLEGSWTTKDHGVPTGPIVYGTTGTLVVEYRGEKEIVRLERGGGNSSVFEGDPLPEGKADIAQVYINHLETGEPLHPTLDVPLNLDAMAILDAGLRAANSNKLEIVNSKTWEIG
jgi:predicted dehydrogenase